MWGANGGVWSSSQDQQEAIGHLQCGEGGGGLRVDVARLIRSLAQSDDDLDPNNGSGDKRT